MVKRVLSLFSGCGGMDLGFEGSFSIPKSLFNPMSGNWIAEELPSNRLLLNKNDFEVVFANDINKAARNAWLSYFVKRGSSPDIVHLRSIVDLVEEYRNGNFAFPSSIDVVIGGFPCQDFSVCGKRKGFDSYKNHLGKKIDNSTDTSENSRGQLYKWMKAVIEIVDPKVFVAENVKGLLSLQDCKERIEKDFCSTGTHGYIVIPGLLFAPNYGIPQTRERVFFIGLNRKYLRADVITFLEQGYSYGCAIDPLPPETHYPIGKSPRLWNEPYHCLPCPPLSAVISDLPEPSELLDDLSQAKYTNKSYNKGHQGNTEVKLNGLAPTITAEHNGNINYRRLSRERGGTYIHELDKGYKERRLTVRECARIQTFPDDFSFVIPKDSEYPLAASNGYKLIGNAVPPFLAYHVAKRLDTIWDTLF